MKRLVLIFSIILPFLTGCTESPAEPEQPEQNTQQPSTTPGEAQLNLDASENKEIGIEAESSTYVLEILSQSPWTLTISETKASTWLTADKTEGSGNDKVTFTIAENRVKGEREATVTVFSEKKKSKISITQKSYGPSNLTLSPAEIETDYTAKSLLLELSSDLKWEITSGDASICVPSPVRGNAGETNIKLAITENQTDQNREVILNVFSGYDQKNVRITQARKKAETTLSKGIKTLDDLCRFRDAVNKGEDLSEWKYNGEINLLGDINLSYVENWEPIGSSEKNAFKEIFNGNGFTIREVTINYNSPATGFFGWNCGTIKNLNIAMAEITNKYEGHSEGHTGGIAGCSEPQGTGQGGIIRNCTFSGILKCEGNRTDCFGITYNIGGENNISDCTSYGIVYGEPISNKYNKNTCKDEGLSNASFPVEFYNLLKRRGVLTEEKYYSKAEIFAAIDAYDKSISLDIEQFGLTDSQVINRFRSISEIYIYGNYFESLDLRGKGIRTFSNRSKYNGKHGGYVKDLNLSGCPLKEFEYIESDSEYYLKNLDISNTTEVIEKLDLSTINLTNLKADGAKIKELILQYVYELDVSGSEYLEKIVCQSSYINIKDCPNLYHIEAGFFEPSIDFSPYPKLNTLIITHGSVKSIDVSKNSELAYISITYSELRELKLGNNTNLRYLDCSTNRMESLDISGCPNLETIYCGNHYDSLNINEKTLTLTPPDGFSNVWSKFKSEYLNRNVVLKGELIIPDAMFKYVVEQMGIYTEDDAKTVKYLDLSHVDVMSIEGIEYFTELETLLAPWHVQGVLDLSHNTKLKYLETQAKVDLTILPLLEHLGYGHVETDDNAAPIDLSKNPKLTYLNINLGKDISTSLDISRQTELEQLHIKGENVNIPGIDLSNLPKLKRLGLNIPIENVNLSNLSELEHLTVNCPLLNELDLKNNKKLNYLSCSGSTLKGLDLNNNTLLERVYCSKCGLTELNIGALTALDYLNCSDNALSAIDVSHNTALTSLYCSNNNLTALDVTQNTVLKNLSCSNNELTSVDLTKTLIAINYYTITYFKQKKVGEEYIRLELIVTEEQYEQASAFLDEFNKSNIHFSTIGGITSIEPLPPITHPTPVPDN